MPAHHAPSLSRRRRLLLQAVLDSQAGTRRRRLLRRGRTPALLGWVWAIALLLFLLGICNEYFL